MGMIKLFFSEGPEAGKNFEFESDAIYIGRSPDSDIQVKDILVSRKHLKVSRKDNKYLITDLQSSNGTMIDNVQINSEAEIEVGEGIPIRIGVSVLSVGKPFEKKPKSDFNATIYSDAKSSLYKAIDEKRPMTLRNNMDLIYKVSNLFKEFSNLNEALDKALSYILDLLKRVDRGFIILIDHEKGRISDVISESRSGLLNSDMNYDGDLVNQVIRDRNAVMISNVHSEEDIGFSDTLKLINTGSVMCLPLISGSKLQGVIYIDSIEKAYGFRVEDLDLLNALSVPIALAIENSKH